MINKDDNEKPDNHDGENHEDTSENSENNCGDKDTNDANDDVTDDTEDDEETEEVDEDEERELSEEEEEEISIWLLREGAATAENLVKLKKTLSIINRKMDLNEEISNTEVLEYMNVLNYNFIALMKVMHALYLKQETIEGALTPVVDAVSNLSTMFSTFITDMSGIGASMSPPKKRKVKTTSKSSKKKVPPKNNGNNSK